jgi:glycosyltransferase involved in cell wall biosynthesis
MKISVVIPTYNRARSLGNTLRSLVDQTLAKEDYEVIVVDDGSTDNTSEIISLFEGKVNLKYIQQSNAGPATARNRGAEAAQFPIILFFDDDVVADQHLLQAHIDEHARHDPCSILGYTPFADNLPNTSVIDYHRDRWDRIFADAVEYQRDQGNLPFSHFITINLSVRKRDFEQIGPFNQALSVAAYEDTELGRRFANAGIPHYFCEAAYATHHPCLDITSLTQRRYRFGRVAGNYYLNHPDDTEMHRSMNVGYVLSTDTSRLSPIQRMRRLVGNHIIMTPFGAKVAAILGQQNLVPRSIRLYLLRVVSAYWYRLGFKESVLRHSRES